MRGRARPLLCELHAHTTWSDGELSLGAVVDLYGKAGFDMLCVTDHVLRGDDPWPLRHGRPCVDVTNVGGYLAEIERERARALSAYGLLLVPGLELTYNDPNPDRAGHAVAVGLQSFVCMDEGPAAAIEEARAAGAAILAAHPHDFGPTAAVPSRRVRKFRRPRIRG
jgi:3',5'-nucleoside bisphosphate phosphatase